MLPTAAPVRALAAVSFSTATCGLMWRSDSALHRRHLTTLSNSVVSKTRPAGSCTPRCVSATVLMIADQAPPHWPATPSHVQVYVPDVDETYNRALEAGAVPVQEPVRKETGGWRGDSDRACTPSPIPRPGPEDDGKWRRCESSLQPRPALCQRGATSGVAQNGTFPGRNGRTSDVSTLSIRTQQQALRPWHPASPALKSAPAARSRPRPSGTRRSPVTSTRVGAVRPPGRTRCRVSVRVRGRPSPAVPAG